jgi:outer membrane protein TolC
MHFPRFFWLHLSVALPALAAGAIAETGETVALADKIGAVPLALLDALPERALPELQRVLDHALEHAPSVLIQRWSEQQALANARASRAAMLPTVSGYVSGGPALEQREVTGERGKTVEESITPTLFYNAGVSQPLFHWGALSKSYQATRLYAAISARNLEETRRLLAVDLRRRFFDLVIAEGALNLARKTLAQLRQSLDQSKTQVAAGFAPPIEFSQVEQRILYAEIDVQRLTNDRDILRNNYARLTGLRPATLPAPAADMELPAVPKSLGEAVNALDPEASAPPSFRLLNADDTIRAERLNYEVQKVRLWPKLSASLSVTQDKRSPDFNPDARRILTTTYGAFATVNWTLFDGFSAQAAQRASLSRLRSHEIDRDLTARQETDERRAEVAKIQLAWRQLQESEKLLSSARFMVTTTEKDVKAGWLPRSALEDAQRDADNAVQAINIARAEFYTTLATFVSNRFADPALR